MCIYTQLPRWIRYEACKGDGHEALALSSSPASSCERPMSASLGLGMWEVGGGRWQEADGVR